MKITIKTSVLKDMVARAIKGAGCNKLIPLTSMMSIEVTGNKLVLHTTDMTNHLYIMQNIDAKEFYVTVGVEQFSKLIGRMTCENVSLEVKANALEVKGNGTYNIELPLDENGDLIKFPDPYADANNGLTTSRTVALSTIKAILNTAKASVANTMEIPCYTGYYFGDTLLTTDTFKICSMGVKLFDEPVLISQEMMNLLDIMESENVNVNIGGDIIIFTSPDCVVYGYKMDCIEDFAVGPITGLLETEFDSVCRIAKVDILATLDRIALFVGTYDDKAIRLNFTPEGISVSSKKSDGVELIDYKESENFKPFTCLIDIELFTTQIKADSSDIIELHYGNDKFVSITNTTAKSTQIIALLADM